MSDPSLRPAFLSLEHLTLAEGTSQIQQLVIGRELLGIDAIRGG